LVAVNEPAHRFTAFVGLRRSQINELGGYWIPALGPPDEAGGLGRDDIPVVPAEGA
jgi:hypothetical protein